MGYQEAYVTTKNQKDFSELLNYIKELGREYFENVLSEPVEVITLNQNINGDFGMMCKPTEKYSFNVGDKFIYFVGERYPLRCATNLLGNKILKEKFNVEIIFTECFPSDEIFQENGFAKHERFDFE